MKIVLFVLLAASLAANIVLGLRTSRSASTSSADPSASIVAKDSSAAATSDSLAANDPIRASASTNSGTSSATPKPASGPVPQIWHPVSSDEDMHRTVANLRAAGYPPAVVRAVVNQLLNERFAPRQPNAGQPFWKQGAPTSEMVAKQNALNQERQTLFEALLGPDARPSAVMDEAARLRRYGNLSDEKIDAISRIERDYSEMTAEAWAKRRGNILTSSDAAMQAQQLMEKEKLADLAAVLTPEELAEYDMRHSSAARSLINSLRNVEISAAEYAQLYEAQKTFAAANPMRSNMDPNAWVQRQAGQRTLNEQARAVLGEERFYHYLEGSDRMYAQVAKAFSDFPSVTPPQAYQVYQLQTDLQTVMYQASRDGPPSQEKMAEMRTVAESYNARLESLIGAEVAEAYRKQGNGRMFNSFRNAPRPPSSTQAPAAGR